MKNKFKIDPSLKNKNLSQDISEQLGFIYPSDVKSGVIVFVLLLYDLPLLLGLLSLASVKIAWVLSPFILLFHVWGVRFLIKNPYTTQFEMILFTGSLGLMSSLSLFVIVQGILLQKLELGPVYYTVITILFLIGFFVIAKYQINKLTKDPTIERKRSKIERHLNSIGSALLGSGGLGTMGYVSGQRLEPSFFATLVLIGFFMLFNFYIGAKFLLRFYFMKINPSFINYHPLSNKKKKKVLKQGIKLK